MHFTGNVARLYSTPQHFANSHIPPPPTPTFFRVTSKKKNRLGYFFHPNRFPKLHNVSLYSLHKRRMHHSPTTNANAMQYCCISALFGFLSNP